MRKLFSFQVTSVDGYDEGPKGEFDWPVVDQEFNQFALKQLEEVDTLLFGRVTYQLMASYWPTPAAAQDDPKVAAKMNSLPKLVVSRTLAEATWATRGWSAATSPPSLPGASSSPARTCWSWAART